MIETVEHPTFRLADFAVADKKPGLSAVVRLHNEEDFGYAALTCIVPYFDEIVIVFNDCTDRTPEIVADLVAEYPQIVKAFRYIPQVVRPGGTEHRRLSPKSVHSLVYYYNFALSKASYQIRCKWDGDHIAIPEGFGRVVEELHRLKRGTLDWWLSPWRLGYWWYTGVNLWERDNRVYVPKLKPVVGSRRDNGFFPAGRLIHYRHYARAEYLFTRVLRHRFVGYLFYHLKGMKRDRGIGNYLFDDKQAALPKRFRANPELQTFQEFVAHSPAARDLAPPEALGIRPLSH